MPPTTSQNPASAATGTRSGPCDAIRSALHALEAGGDSVRASVADIGGLPHAVEVPDGDRRGVSHHPPMSGFELLQGVVGETFHGSGKIIEIDSGYVRHRPVQVPGVDTFEDGRQPP